MFQTNKNTYLPHMWGCLVFYFIKTSRSTSHRFVLEFLKIFFHSIFLTVPVDPTLGKVDKPSLSTQTLMEIFIEGIENREVICGNAEEPAEVEKWRGFEYSEEDTTDEEEKHFGIEWISLKLVGTIDLQWLPPTVLLLHIIANKLSGSLNLTAPPLRIQCLGLQHNTFSGKSTCVICQRN